MKILEYIYYRLFCIVQKTNAKDIAEYVACLWLVVLLGLNIVVLIGNLGFTPLKQVTPIIYGLLLFTPLMVLMYVLFLREKRYLKVERHYSKETNQQHKIGQLILLAYIVITFAALIFL